MPVLRLCWHNRGLGLLVFFPLAWPCGIFLLTAAVFLTQVLVAQHDWLSWPCAASACAAPALGPWRGTEWACLYTGTAKDGIFGQPEANLETLSIVDNSNRCVLPFLLLFFLGVAGVCEGRLQRLLAFWLAWQSSAAVVAAAGQHQTKLC